MKTLEKDILLICKGWYNKDKYNTILDAFNAYYRQEYGNEDIVMDKKFAIELFLKPTYKMYGSMGYLFEPSWKENICNPRELYETDFVSVFYHRLINGLIQVVTKRKIDLSDYKDMIDKAKETNYEDDTIGIV